MASLQQKTCRGHKYWAIVESRRVNGKPRPIVLAHLGKAEELLRRLQHMDGHGPIKSYSHGAVAALLRLAAELDIPSIINKHVCSERTYTPVKPVRHHLTVGATLLLGAIGRVCMPTSKQGWWTWAQTTSCEYLLRVALSGVDSQHFWDLMDSLPVSAIEIIEQELLKPVRQLYGIASDTLFFDTTNFFTFIATTNEACSLPQRTKSKQKRNDLRAIGLALVVTREDQLPVFHLTYQGNQSDSNVFKGVVERIKQRLTALGLAADKHTLVFDRGNNSKANLALVAQAEFHYVGALTPYQHQKLVAHAMKHFAPLDVGGKTLDVFRARKIIWGQQRTVVVLVSERLKAGQVRGIYTSLEKVQTKLKRLGETINAPSQAGQERAHIEQRIRAILNHQFIKDLVTWSLEEAQPGPWQLNFAVAHDRLAELEKTLGLRILMTDRDEWSTVEIIEAYYGQANVEAAFKNVKNPYHLAIRPQFHWTDQKIKVHYFMCILGYLLTTLLWREARTKTGFKGSLDSLLDTLNGIRLAACTSISPGKRGPRKISYQLEELDDTQRALAQALDIMELHLNRPRLDQFSVYAHDNP